jgi:hypothetical protein
MQRSKNAGCNTSLDHLIGMAVRGKRNVSGDGQ